MTSLCFGMAAGTASSPWSIVNRSPICETRFSGVRGVRTIRPRRVRRGTVLVAAAEAPLPEQLASDDFLERIRGINRIEEVSEISDKLSALIPIATEDPNQQVRYAAISRIASFDHTSLSDEDAEKVLSAARFVMLNDKESSCQSGAADVIAGLKLSDGFDDLVDMFNRTSDWMLKFSIAAGLGEMGDPKAFDFLTSVLDNDQESEFLLKAAAIGALGELGDERGIPVIEKFLSSEDPSIRERAKIAHTMLTGKE